MSIDCIGEPRSTVAGPPTVDRRLFVPGVTHKDIHAKPQHGCGRCPPTPCVCGWTVGMCSDAFEHRRGFAGAEQSWREVAA
jgi:hypothetical protein